MNDVKINYFIPFMSELKVYSKYLYFKHNGFYSNFSLDDLVQDTFLNYVKYVNSGNMDDNPNILPLLRTIMYRTFINSNKSFNKKFVKAFPDLENYERSSYNMYIDIDRKLYMSKLQLLRDIKITKGKGSKGNHDIQRKKFSNIVLMKYEGYNNKEIAQKLNCTHQRVLNIYNIGLKYKII